MFDLIALISTRGMLGKIFKLKRDEIAPVALSRGGCLSTDRIVVDGEPVGYM